MHPPARALRWHLTRAAKHVSSGLLHPTGRRHVRVCSSESAPASPKPFHMTGAELRDALEAVASEFDAYRSRETSAPVAPLVEWLVSPRAEQDWRRAVVASQRAQRDVIGQGLPRSPHPGGIRPLIADLFREMDAESVRDGHGGYMAWIPAGGVTAAAVGELVSHLMNKYTTLFLTAPGLAQMEHTVVDWMQEMVCGRRPAHSAAAEAQPSVDLAAPPPARESLTDRPGGVLTTGGSLATLYALVAARTRCADPRALHLSTVYVSEQTHYCVQESATVAGMLRENVRLLPTDDEGRVRLDALQDAIAEDVRAGLRPTVVVGVAGSTGTGAVDDLVSLASIARDAGAWFHVDAAYGGFFALTSHGARLLRPGLALADSVVVDPHKSLFLPYGTGGLLVRRAADLSAAFSCTGACMQPPVVDGAPLPADAMNLAPELSRDHRGVRVWLPLKLLGVDVFQQALDERLAWAREVEASVRRSARLRVVHAPQLSILTVSLSDDIVAGVLHRMRATAQAADARSGSQRPGADRVSVARQGNDADLTQLHDAVFGGAVPAGVARDALNKELLRRVNARGRVMLTGLRDVWGRSGGFLVRVAILSSATTHQHVQWVCEDLEAAAQEAEQVGEAVITREWAGDAAALRSDDVAPAEHHPPNAQQYVTQA